MKIRLEMAYSLTSNGLTLNGTLANINSNKSVEIVGVSGVSASVSGTGTSHAAGTVTLSSISVGSKGTAVYNNSTKPSDNSTTHLDIRLPASGRYFIDSTAEYSGGITWPSAASVSDTLTIDRVDLDFVNKTGSSGGSTAYRLTNSSRVTGSVQSRSYTRYTCGVLYYRIS